MSRFQIINFFSNLNIWTINKLTEIYNNNHVTFGFLTRQADTILKPQNPSLVSKYKRRHGVLLRLLFVHVIDVGTKHVLRDAAHIFHPGGIGNGNWSWAIDIDPHTDS